MYYVYVIKSLKTGEYYKGLTNDIERRISEHLNKRSRFTKNILPIRLIHVELCKNREEARRLEKYFKSGYGREIVREIDNC